MGIIVPRVGIELTSLAFRASVLSLHHVGFPDVTTIPTPTCLCTSLPQRSVQKCKSLSAYNYMRACNGLTYKYTGQIQQPHLAQLEQDPGHGTSVVDVMKMGIIVPRVGIKPPSLAFWASVLPLHRARSLMSPLYPLLPICAAPCLRGQCIPLHFIRHSTGSNVQLGLPLPHPMVGWLLEFYVLATSIVISGWVLTPDGVLV